MAREIGSRLRAPSRMEQSQLWRNLPDDRDVSGRDIPLSGDERRRTLPVGLGNGSGSHRLRCPHPWRLSGHGPYRLARRYSRHSPPRFRAIARPSRRLAPPLVRSDARPPRTNQSRPKTFDANRKAARGTRRAFRLTGRERRLTSLHSASPQPPREFINCRRRKSRGSSGLSSDQIPTFLDRTNASAFRAQVHPWAPTLSHHTRPLLKCSIR